MYPFDENMFDESPVIEIINIDDFISWMRQQSLTLALIQIGRNFFRDPGKYIGQWEYPEQSDLPDEEVFDEMVPYLFSDNDEDRFYMMSKDAHNILQSVTNRLIYMLLNNLVDNGVLEMCWNTKTNDFMWRVSLK